VRVAVDADDQIEGDAHGSSAAPRSRQDWARRYARWLAFTDFLVVLWVVVGAQLLRFGVTNADVSRDSGAFGIELNYTLITTALILVWLLALSVFRTREARVIGAGFDEYRQLTVATLTTFGLAAVVFYLAKLDIARAYVLMALPLGLVVLLLSRWLWRQWLQARRRQGHDTYRVVLVGSLSSALPIVRDLARAYGAGYRVLAAVVPDGTGLATLPGTRTPVSTDISRIRELMLAYRADTLVIASTDHLPADRVRELSWQLEPGRQHLVMAPNLTDVGGPRIHMRPVAGLPLMHVETPAFEGAQLFLKRMFDIFGSGLLIVVLSPLLAGVAIAVKASSRGPVLFGQERVGHQGRPFRMLKFRSMVSNAEDLLPSLLDRQRDAGNSVMFKLKDDPRVTSVGRFIRRHSIDELPQLFNVFGGSMSLVGPRPPLAREVATYDRHVHRKFLVKPGITGLWQVNGRSSLSWDESVRLDLFYVENWSLMGDIIILWRTLKAVIRRDGAY